MHPEVAEDDLAHCRRLLRHGSKSFSLASRLLPRSVADSATVLYAFCRVADDAIDSDPHASEATVDRLMKRLDRVYRGSPDDDPVDRALALVVHRRGVPRALPEALIEGFLWDATSRTYDTLDDLYGYAARVAGTVGAMMTVLMGQSSVSVLSRACDLGVAMQLTNIARDVGEDAARGRIYLPLSWLRETGIEPEAWLRKPAYSGAVAACVKRLLEAADVLYARADSGIPALPSACRPSIRAARLLYAEIGSYVARNGYDSVTRRAVVPWTRKLWLVFRAFAGGRERPTLLHEPPLEPVRFLVTACE